MYTALFGGVQSFYVYRSVQRCAELICIQLCAEVCRAYMYTALCRGVHCAELIFIQLCAEVCTVQSIYLYSSVLRCAEVQAFIFCLTDTFIGREVILITTWNFSYHVTNKNFTGK